MSQLNLGEMRQYLSKSYSSLNLNKLNGLLAEIEFRNHLVQLGFGDRVSVGGWIARSEGPGRFGHDTIVMFPDTIRDGVQYPTGRVPATPPLGLHTICSTFHQIGIRSYFCVPSIAVDNDVGSVTWSSTQLGLPVAQPLDPFPQGIAGFRPRARKHSFLRYKTDVSLIRDAHVPEEFSKEHLRVSFQEPFFAEISDIDGIFWGHQYTYPIEIKEKTAATDKRLGDFFGLDLGPFVKLAYYAAKRGNLHSVFVVREIADTTSRALVDWWYITFDRLAQYASWNPIAGGTNMQGGGSVVVKIPKAEFQRLDATALNAL